MGYMKTKDSIRLDEFDAPASADARRYTDMHAVSMRSSPYNLLTSSDGNSVNPITFDTRMHDTGGMWNGSFPSRLTIPAGGTGMWRARAQITFPANATGVREVYILLTIASGSTTEVGRVQIPASAGARPQYLPIQTREFFARAGDYVQLHYYQDSGSTLAMATAGSYFELERLGDARGKWDACDFSADFGHRRNWTAWDTLIESSGLTIAPDPINPSRLAGRIECDDSNNSVLYPRVQAQTGADIGLTSNVYFGFSILIPQETFDRLEDGAFWGFNVHELYGPPFGGNSTALIQFRTAEGFTLRHGKADGTVINLWNLPPENCVGRWVDFIHRINLSTNPAVGYQSLWVNKGDGNGLVQQTLTDGVVSNVQLPLQTVVTAVNGGGNNFGSLKISYGTEDGREPMVIYVGEYRKGTSQRAVTTDRADYSRYN